jgi:ribosomal-protein-alanine N-acetyltransferase
VGDELRSARLLLRPFRTSDLENIERYAHDAEYLRYLGAHHPGPGAFVTNNVETDWDRAPAWVICTGNEVVGSVFLGIDVEDGVAELACLVAPAHWGKGIAGEAGGLAVDYAFERCGMAKVVARAHADNQASIRAMEKLGMTREAVLRSHRRTRAGNRTDEVVYSLLRSEWETSGQRVQDSTGQSRISCATDATMRRSCR